MSEEIKKEEQPIVVDNSNVIEEYKNSQAYIDDVNALKGKWAEAYKADKLPGMVDKEVETRLRARETKTPEQIKFDEYETKLAAMQNQIAEKEVFEMRSKNKELARGKFKEAGLPDTLLDFFVSEDETKTNDNIGIAIEALTGFKTSIKQDALGNNNIKVPGSDVVTDTKTGHGIPVPTSANPKEWEAYHKKVRDFNRNKG